MTLKTPHPFPFMNNLHLCATDRSSHVLVLLDVYQVRWRLLRQGDEVSSEPGIRGGLSLHRAAINARAPDSFPVWIETFHDGVTALF